ncbi:hypothetical protein [Microbacterium excoecariae]|uniref:hypothetical protein n=1 Tax=Microbacterium excoecariae TaxID=2715210 RepID=UPI001409E459|nr:hypothetical protein [Microbacterium excoecariae]NHI17188.1 hypothetical protein [Microbacterium excoecariae]
MTTTRDARTAPREAEAFLPARRVRRTVAGEHPLPAALVQRGEGTWAVVDAADLDGWSGWRWADAPHVLAPREILRRAGGHDVVVPSVASSVENLLGARAQSGPAWDRGEAVTLAVAVMRAAAAVDPETVGSWWLDEDGMPLFCPRAGDAEDGDAIPDASARILERLERATDDRVLARALAEARDALATPRSLAASLEGIEAALFDAASARPIRSAAAAGARAGIDRHLAADDADEGTGLAAWLARAAGMWDAGLAGILARLSPAERSEQAGPGRAHPRDRARPAKTARRPGRRRAPIVVALGAAAVIVGVGLVWPAGDPPRASGAIANREGSTPGGDVVASAPSHPGLAGEDPALAGEDPAAAGAALVALWQDCAGTCDQVPSEAVGGSAAHPDVRVSLVEDYGQVAVVAAEAPGSARQLIVIERAGETWRIRDAYDAATGTAARNTEGAAP